MPRVDESSPLKERPPAAPILGRKTRTERVDDALKKVLQDENADEIIKKLKPEEQALFWDMMDLIREGKISDVEAIQNDLWKVDFTRKPPTVEEFTTDHYWLGEVLETREDNPGIFPIWRKILHSDFNIDSRIHNAVFTGSLGIGKTYIMCSVFLYRLALTRLLRNPQNFFGLGRGSLIFYAILSLTRAVVRDTAFGEIMNFMGHSPFFQEECHFNPDAKYSDGNIELGNQLVLKAGSKGWHLIGRNVMGVCLDEGNYRLEANPDEKAYQLYDEVRTRIQNRFQKLAGYLPAVSILASSARDESSFTERVIKDIRDASDESTQKVYSFSVYVARRHALTLKDRWFKVEYGLKNIDPRVLSGWYREDGTPLEVKDTPHEEATKGALTELVPEDYHDAFVRDTRTALMNVSGKSVGGTHRLFSSMVNVYRCIELSRGLKNPCKVDVIPLSNEDSLHVWDYLDHPTFLTRRESRIAPLHSPESIRYVHLDLASTGMAGLGICHRAGQQLIHDIRDGEPFDEMRLIVQYDFVLTIGPGKNNPISLEKIQRFIFWLRDKCNFRFGLITADQWQSVLPLEMLATRGFLTKQLSLDRSKGPYLSWKSGFDDLRIRTFEQKMMLHEMEHLRNLDSVSNSSSPTAVSRGKIDHPPLGSKDTTDGAAGAYYNAITSDLELGSGSASQVGLHVPNAMEADVEKPPIDFPVDVPTRPGEEVTFNA